MLVIIFPSSQIILENPSCSRGREPAQKNTEAIAVFSAFGA
jgi:hypothetical protein